MDLQALFDRACEFGNVHEFPALPNKKKRWGCK